ncbi:MAG TPA: fructose-bisphosphate aldolase [Caldisericia bacterium]|nr:fructose-bisphosphate aldolase [Caldisericia bacterium]
MNLSSLSTGKKVRMIRMAFEHGPGNGKLMILPIDQGLEHGPKDFFANPESLDPRFEFELALRGNYSAIALHIGLADKYMCDYAGKVPLVLKLNGKTNIPPDDEAFSSLTSTVEDAVRIGADAVGYTLFVGSPRQDEDISQLCHVRRDCDRFGMPLIVWSYPRGKFVDAKGGKDCLYAIDYAARAALEVGADVIKVNFPNVSPAVSEKQPEPYKSLREAEADAIKRVVKSAGKAAVIISGGEKISDDDLLKKVQMSVDAGVTGFIFGRNMWQRPIEKSLELTEKIRNILTSR